MKLALKLSNFSSIIPWKQFQNHNRSAPNGIEYIYIYIAKPSSWYQIYSILCTNGQCQKDCRNGYIQVTKLQTKRVNNSVRLQSSHLPQVIKPRLQVIIYSTIHPACGFSLSRNISCCDRLSNCSGRSLDKLVYRRKNRIAYQYHPSIYKPE